MHHTSGKIAKKSAMTLSLKLKKKSSFDSLIPSIIQKLWSPSSHRHAGNVYGHRRENEYRESTEHNASEQVLRRDIYNVNKQLICAGYRLHRKAAIPIQRAAHTYCSRDHS